MKNSIVILLVAIGLYACDRGCYMKPDKKSKETKAYIHKRYPEYKPYKK